jgi:hypothetical protein
MMFRAATELTSLDITNRVGSVDQKLSNEFQTMLHAKSLNAGADFPPDVNRWARFARQKAALFRRRRVPS